MVFRLIFWLMCFITITVICSEAQNNDVLQSIQRGFREYQETKVRPVYLDESLKKFKLPHFFRRQEHATKHALNGSLLTNALICDLCSVVVNFVVEERRSGMSDVSIKSELESICKLLNIESPRVCTGSIELNADIILYIVDNNPSINPTKFCDLMLQDNACNFTNIEWTIDVPEGLSPLRPKPVDSPATFKVLHVTDFHVDPMYTPNKAKTCNEPLCCQSDQDDGVGQNACGYWAEYGNDVSESLVDEFIRFANTFDVDYVYFTGDIVPHRMWSTTQEGNADIIDKFLRKLKNGFSVPVFPTLGNHEATPLNQFVLNNSIPSNLSTKWLFDLIEQEWSEWLPQSAMQTIAKGGFYTISPIEGFRIIVINSNVAYRACWWLLQDDEDPFDHLTWLIEVLLEAEANNESVHILGHIPTGSVDIFKVWSREYNKIINRFANTITGQFTGHVHVDTFQVHYNISNPNQAINIEWNGASIVPYDNANPSFKIYSIDKETFNIIDIDQWTFNLTEANENSDLSPDWYKIYSFREAFNVPTLQPEDIGKLLVDMAEDHNLLGEYHIYRYKNSGPGTANGCDENCQKDYLCELSTAVYGETSKCEYLKELYDLNL